MDSAKGEDMITVKRAVAATVAIAGVVFLILVCLALSGNQRRNADSAAELNTFTQAYDSIQPGAKIDEIERMLSVPEGRYDWRDSDEVTVLGEARWQSGGRLRYYHGEVCGLFVYFDSATGVVHGKELVSVRRRSNLVVSIWRDLVTHFGP